MRYPELLLGVAPTHRNDASFPMDRCMWYKRRIFDRLKELNVNFIDIEDVCPNGLLSVNRDVNLAAEKFRAKKIDALFLPFVDFGSEGAACQLASKLNVPVLVWGPRDATAQGNDGDIQCGMIAAGKVFRRFNLPFTYFPTCFLEDGLFERAFNTFLAAANVVKEFKNCYVLQVGPRPESFWSVMCNEGELLERFGIKTYPISMTEITAKTKDILKNQAADISKIVSDVRSRADIHVNDGVLEKSAALKLSLDYFRKETLTTCCAFQCWYSLQQELGIWPCTAMSLLNEEGFPAVCETDVHGAITCLLATAAAMGRTTPLFVDWCFRHPKAEHAEYVAHCGNCSMELFEGRPAVGTRCFEFAKDMGGHVCGPVKGGNVSFFRFDGDQGGYSMLLGTAKSVDLNDPCKRGARMWLEVPDVRRLERHLVYGPYIHHCAIIHEDITPVMLEAGKYLGVTPDFVYPEQHRAAQDYLMEESLPNGPAGLTVTPGEPMIG